MLKARNFPLILFHLIFYVGRKFTVKWDLKEKRVKGVDLYVST